MRLDDTRHLLLAGALVGGVLGTLTLAAVLQTGEPAAEPTVVTGAALGVPDAGAAPSRLPLGASTETVLPPPPSTTAPPPEVRPIPRAAEPQAPPPAPPERQPQPIREPSKPVRETPPPKPKPKPKPASTTAASTGPWTLQFMVTCRAELVERLDQSLGNDDRLRLAPVSLDGRACHRVLWGRYPDRQTALEAPDIPSVLAELKQNPMPRPLTGVAP